MEFENLVEFKSSPEILILNENKLAWWCRAFANKWKKPAWCSWVEINYPYVT